MSHHPQAARFREQAEGCLPASPLSAALLSAMADDLDAGGVTAKAVAGHEGDRPGTVLPLRMLAALHRLVLEGRAPALSSFYPSVGGAALGGAAWPAAAAAMREHLADMHLLVDQTVQTNEPGRASLLFGGLLVVAERTGLPIRLLEIGSSAGLTLLVDRYRYAIGERVLGDPDSALRFDQPWTGTPPASLDQPLRLVERRGCDPRPVDPTTTDGQLTLTSYVWADWAERIDRLRAALRVAAPTPPPVDRARAAAWLPAQLAASRPGTVTVVWHSVVWQYLDRDERSAIRSMLGEAAAAATPVAPVAHLAFEPRRDADDSLRFELTLSLSPGTGEEQLLARAPGHGIPTRWATDPVPGDAGQRGSSRPGRGHRDCATTSHCGGSRGAGQGTAPG